MTLMCATPKKPLCLNTHPTLSGSLSACTVVAVTAFDHHCFEERLFMSASTKSDTMNSLMTLVVAVTGALVRNYDDVLHARNTLSY